MVDKMGIKRAEHSADQRAEMRVGHSVSWRAVH